MYSVENLVRLVLVSVLAYLVGAFPTGYLLVRLFTGRDVRRIGSGRTGGTNVLRTAGALPAAVTVVVDALKGGSAILLARAIGGTPLAISLAAVAAIVGHNYSVFLGWDGGAGTMTMIGVALFVHPPAGVAAIVLGVAILAVWRYASLASISIALVLPIIYGTGALWGDLPGAYVVYSAIVGAISIFELRPNIARLLAGTERKVSIPAQASSGARK